MHLQRVKVPYRKEWFFKQIEHLPKPIKLMSLLIFTYTLGWAIATPFLPIYFKEILGNYTAVGIVISLQAFFAMLWDLPVGALIDKISKRKIIKFALFLYIPFSFILLAMKTLSHFIIFRVYHAFIVTPLWLSADSYTRAHSPKGRSTVAFSLYDTGVNLAFVIGPIIGGLLFYKLGYSIIYSISIMSAIAFIGAFFLPDHKKGKVLSSIKDLIIKDGIVKTEFKDFFSNKNIMKVSLILFLYTFGSSFMGMLLPLFMREFGASYFQVGLIYSLFYIPLLLELYFGTKNNKFALLIMSFLIGAGLFTALFFTKSLIVVFILSALLAVCFAAIYPTLQGKMTEFIPKSKIGEMTGINTSIRHLALGLGPIMAGIISDVYGLKYVFLVGAVTFFILAMLVVKGRTLFLVGTKKPQNI